MNHDFQWYSYGYPVSMAVEKFEGRAPKFPHPNIQTMQGEWVWFKDSKYILHEILDWRAWKGRARKHGLLWAN